MLNETPKWQELLLTNDIDILITVVSNNQVYFKAKTMGSVDKVKLENNTEFNLTEFVDNLDYQDFRGLISIEELH
jgi:hypothetical protein